MSLCSGTEMSMMRRAMPSSRAFQFKFHPTAILAGLAAETRAASAGGPGLRFGIGRSIRNSVPASIDITGGFRSPTATRFDGPEIPADQSPTQERDDGEH